MARPKKNEDDKLVPVKVMLSKDDIDRLEALYGGGKSKSVREAVHSAISLAVHTPLYPSGRLSSHPITLHFYKTRSTPHMAASLLCLEEIDFAKLELRLLANMSHALTDAILTGRGPQVEEKAHDLP